MSTENTLPDTPLKDVLAKATAYKRGAMVGAGLGLMTSLFIVKGRYVLCIFGGALVGGYLNYKLAESKQNPPAFVNYGIKETEPVAQTNTVTEQTTNNLQQDLINSADGNSQ